MSPLFFTADSAEVGSDTRLANAISLSPDNRFPKSGVGYVNSHPGRYVEWEVSQEFIEGTLSADSISNHGFAIVTVALKGGGDLKFGDFATEIGTGKYCQEPVLLSLHCEGPFYLGPYQSSLWISAMSDICYDGFMGNFSREDHCEAWNRTWQPGDLVRYAAKGDSGVGVVELVEAHGEHWVTRVHSTSNTPRLEKGKRLVSRSCVELAGVVSLFETEFAICH